MKNPEFTIAMLATVGLGVVGLIAWLRWFFSGTVKPDPWGETVAVQLHAPDSAPVCHRCLAEQSDCAHFCPKCGAAVGDYNNLLPFEQLFSEGEVLRNGTTLKLRRSFLVVTGYLIMPIISVGVLLLPPPFVFIALFVPVYWFYFFRNLFRSGRDPITSAGAATNLPGSPAG
jgi:hypothetical protein